MIPGNQEEKQILEKTLSFTISGEGVNMFAVILEMAQRAMGYDYHNFHATKDEYVALVKFIRELREV